jgi:undecaprenyl-diphosphatase
MYFIFLGLLQGIFEWLPMSSGGIVSTVHGILSDVTLEQSVAFAIWLHIGTSFSILIVFRQRFFLMVKEILSNPLQPSPTLSFLLIATVVGSIVGISLITTLGRLSSMPGSSVMGVTGILMLISGLSQTKRPLQGFRSKEDLKLKDSVITGIIQGISVLPGISRSGMTMSLLLHRQFDKHEALLLNFLLTIPLSLIGALYVGITQEFLWSTEALLAAVSSCLVGIISIHALIGLANKLNFALITISLASLMISGAILDLIF